MSRVPMRMLAVAIVVLAAFAARGTGTSPQVAPAGRLPNRSVESPAFGPIHPRLSPSGEEIVFSYQGAIWRLLRGGGAATRLTDGPGFDIEPTWSPDGRRIVFISTQGYFSGALRIIRATDGAPVSLPKPVTAAEKLSFSPDGKRIVGLFSVPNRGAVLAWLDLASGDLAPLATGRIRPDRYALSHDGKRIAFTTTPDRPNEQGGNNGAEADVWTVSSEGGEPQKLTRFPARIHDLCWSARDQALEVATEAGGVHDDLWEIPLSDPERGASRLTFAQADEGRPSTSDDGRWLLYTDNHRGPTALVVRDLASNTDETIEAPRFDFRKPTGRLALAVTDKADRSPVAARIAIRHEGGKYHAPAGSLYRLHKADLHFYAYDKMELELPEGKYEAIVAHGPEYRVARVPFEIQSGRTTNQAIAMERWVDQRARGWYSGESHIHANYGYGVWYNSPRTMLLQSAGEDLCVNNFMVANSDGNGVFDREYFLGRPDPASDGRTILYWNEEFRATLWGHMTLLNLKHIVEPIYTGFQNTSQPWDAPSNSDVADLTHDQNGLVNYTHPAQNVPDPYITAYSAKAMPMDVALGKIDSLDAMGANHEATVPLWYRLLNCGFRLPASAGTDCFLNRIPSRLPGSDRVYVRVEGAFSYERWIENLKAGRTFVTSGPMLELSAEGHSLGDLVRVPDGGTLRVSGKASSQFPLDRLELVRNGRVIAEAKSTGDRLSIAVEQAIPVDQSGWIALRVYGLPHRDQPGGPVFAHTSPIYLQVPGKPLDSREDAAYFLTWIDRLSADLRRRDRVPARSRAHVESQLAAAREVYEKLRTGK